MSSNVILNVALVVILILCVWVQLKNNKNGVGLMCSMPFMDNMN